MFTSLALIDAHARAHLSLQKLLDHCDGFSSEELSRELAGFGYPSVRGQLHHMIWGQDVWMCVLLGSTLAEERPEDYPALDELRAYRESISAATAEFLRSAAGESLSTRRTMTVGEGAKRELVPAHVMFRIVTHLYQHQGQVAAMCRLLGRPIPPGLDFPLAVNPGAADAAYFPAELADVHTRSHQSLGKLLDHCAGFSGDELARDLGGFGYGTIRHQLHHVIGAEMYWLGALRGEMLIAEDPADMESIDALRAFRARVTATTADWLRNASKADVSTPRKVTAWGPREIEIVPAHVILRTQTHIFQHQGQVAAMCRLLGRPIPPGLDFPLG